jgi:hypothetical protein
LARFDDLEAAPVVQHGASRETFWDEVLEPIVDCSQNVTLLDRYLFGDLAWRDAAGGRARRWDTETVCWILSSIDARPCREPREVVLFGEPPTGTSSAAGVAELIQEHWAPAREGSIGRVEVVCAPWQAPGERLPHDRHIRFDTGVGVVVISGFGRFNRRIVQDPDGVEWAYLWTPKAVTRLVRAENRVRDAREASTATAFAR